MLALRRKRLASTLCGPPGNLFGQLVYNPRYAVFNKAFPEVDKQAQSSQALKAATETTGTFSTNACGSIARLWNMPMLLLGCGVTCATYASMLVFMHAVFACFASKT